MKGILRMKNIIPEAKDTFIRINNIFLFMTEKYFFLIPNAIKRINTIKTLTKVVILAAFKLYFGMNMIFKIKFAKAPINVNQNIFFC